MIDIHLEKLRLIEWLIQLQDTETLERLKKFREQQEAAAYEANLKPMSIEDLVARAEAAERDIEAGRVRDIEDLMDEDW